MKHILRMFFLFTILFSGYFLCSQVVLSSNVEGPTRDSWNADDTINRFEEKYSLPEQVIIIPITPLGTASTDNQSVRELYYYFATRSGFGDFPFHYLVSAEGNVYKGNKYGTEAQIRLGDTQNALFIAYVNDEEGLNINSISVLKDLILENINHYGIDPNNITIRSLVYTMDEKGKLSDVSLKKMSEKWNSDLELIKESVLNEYSPNEVKYNVEVIDTSVPTEEQEPEQAAEVTIKMKNTGEYNLYGSESSNIFVVRTNEFDQRSLFFLNDEWGSPSRVELLKDGERLAVGAEKEFTFKVYVPLYPPEYSEDFVLVDPKENVIEGSEFKLTLKIKEVEGQIIEVQDTPIGYLNVRQTPGLGEVITKVSTGERFIVLDIQTGYYKIRANNKEGWVVGTYVKVVSS